MINSRGREPTILLVEDDALTSEQLGDLLRNNCGRLLLTGNGDQGLRMFEETRPDIVITDILMSGMNGLDMARRMRKIDPAVPIIAVTAYTDMGEFGAAAEIFNTLLLKPLDVGELLIAIERCKEKIRIREDEDTSGTRRASTITDKNR